MTVLASSMIRRKVVNRHGENLGDIKDLIIDTSNGRIAYVVLEFGGILGLGSKLFAVPLSAMEVDAENRRFIFDRSKESLQNAPGFDKEIWPNFTDRNRT